MEHSKDKLKDSLQSLAGKRWSVSTDVLLLLLEHSEPNLKWDTPESKKNYLLGVRDGVNLALTKILGVT